MTAQSTNAKLAPLGLTYWAAGPVTGTTWALTEAGDAVLVNTAGEIIAEAAGTPAQRKAAYRASELEAAIRQPGARVYYSTGAYAAGIEYPHPTKPGMWAAIPFDRAAPASARYSPIAA